MKLLTIVVKPSRSDGVKRALSTIGTGELLLFLPKGLELRKVILKHTVALVMK